MSQPDARPTARPALSHSAFALAFLAAAVFALTSRYPGYVHHDTAEIAMWSTLPWPLGLPKHPPLLPWLFRAYSTIVALNWISIGVLAAANIALGAWAVWQIALLVLDERRAALAALLYGLAPAGTFFALKLNHNGILVSLWPLTILAFFACLRAESTARSIATGIAFGALAASGMLAKYYTGVLLASCVLAWLASTERVRFLLRPGGYVAVGTFALLVAPHVLWMLNEGNGKTLEYALHATESEARPISHFLAFTPVYLLPPVAGFLLLRRWLGSAPHQQPAKARPEILVLSIAPFLLTALLITVFKLHGSTTWSLPDFCVVPVLLAAALAVPSDAALARLKRGAAATLAVVALSGPIVLAIAFRLADPNAVEPRFEAALAGARIFTAATGRPVAFVAGDPQSANSAALAIPSHPRVFNAFDAGSTPWATPELIARDGLLVICRPNTGCDQQVDDVVRKRQSFHGVIFKQRHWLGMAGPIQSFTVTIVPPQGAVVDAARIDDAWRAGGSQQP